ncbi:MAG: hypothetical protein ACLF0P_04285 [Thermoanaerobaculia bacterium]
MPATECPPALGKRPGRFKEIRLGKCRLKLAQDVAGIGLFDRKAKLDPSSASKKLQGNRL